MNSPSKTGKTSNAIPTRARGRDEEQSFGGVERNNSTGLTGRTGRSDRERILARFAPRPKRVTPAPAPTPTPDSPPPPAATGPRALAEIARFEVVAVPTPEAGWIDPEAARNSQIQRVLAAFRAQRVRPPDPEHDLPPPLHMPTGWTPKSWRGRLRQLADLCQRYHPQRAAQLRAWAQGREYTVSAERPPNES